MRSVLALMFFSLFPVTAFAGKGGEAPQGLYGFSVEAIDGKLVDLARYKDKVALVVNTASRCGFTDQYKDLQALYERYKTKGFIVLGFPSNDFAMQEPGSNSEIKKFCDLNYKVKFPMFSKGKVIGPAKQPVYKFLTGSARFSGEISWNFEKFLVSRSGDVVARFEPAVSPLDPKVTAGIEKWIAPGK